MAERGSRRVAVVTGGAGAIGGAIAARLAPEHTVVVLDRTGDVVVDRATRRVTVHGRPVVLSGKEFELLAKLAEQPQRVYAKQELLRDVWGFRSPARTRTLDSHASRLRRKLAEADGGTYVVNVWGVGYRLLRE